MKSIAYVNLGTMSYQPAFELQGAVNRYLQAHPEETGFLFMVEHPPVFTLGRNGQTEDFLFPIEMVKQQGFEVVESNRGGNVTYHGPGQLVGYLLINLEQFKKDVQWYVRTLEEWMIQTLARLGVEGDRKPAYRGVWVGDEKICALGVAIKRWRTMHGFALNHQTNLDHFALINPCGITEYGVTSLEKQGIVIDREQLVQEMLQTFEVLFQCTLENTTLEEVKARVNITEA
ncbi:lipoyl(octanoyl) transferase LipB [Anoxynatronum sibiricum]|uniref:Octanoyltransferase n=1 Tax=Anoxynatronum sibiricum TaxID=210623 RepID=A0ABU9VX69_9CLOT